MVRPEPHQPLDKADLGVERGVDARLGLLQEKLLRQRQDRFGLRRSIAVGWHSPAWRRHARLGGCLLRRLAASTLPRCFARRSALNSNTARLVAARGHETARHDLSSIRPLKFCEHAPRGSDAIERSSPAADRGRNDAARAQLQLSDQAPCQTSSKRPCAPRATRRFLRELYAAAASKSATAHNWNNSNTDNWSRLWQNPPRARSTRFKSGRGKRKMRRPPLTRIRPRSSR